MGLRDTAEADLAFILQDLNGGFGWPIKVTDPNGTVAEVVGTSWDIGIAMDPETGQYVSGRAASVVLRISSLRPIFSTSLPINIMDKDSKPWRVEFIGLDDAPYIFKVASSQPDKTLGIINLMLEVYDDVS